MHALFRFVPVVCLFALTACLTGCAHRLDLGNARMREVRFRDGVPGKQVAAVSTSAAVDVVLGAFERAPRIRASEAERRRLWSSLCFDLIGEGSASGRWLYDPTSGAFTKMDPLMHPVFQMAAEDRLRVNALFPPKS